MLAQAEENHDQAQSSIILTDFKDFDEFNINSEETLIESSFALEWMDVINLDITPINNVNQISRSTNFSARQYKTVESIANDLKNRRVVNLSH